MTVFSLSRKISAGPLVHSGTGARKSAGEPMAHLHTTPQVACIASFTSCSRPHISLAAPAQSATCKKFSSASATARATCNGRLQKTDGALRENS